MRVGFCKGIFLKSVCGIDTPSGHFAGVIVLVMTLIM